MPVLYVASIQDVDVQSQLRVVCVFCKELYMLMSAEEPVDQSGLLQGF